MKRKQNSNLQIKEKVEANRSSPLLDFFSLLYRIDRKNKEQTRGVNEDKKGRNCSCQTK